MSDADVRRLEVIIEAVNREGQLRLDAAVARIEAALARVEAQNALLTGQNTTLTDEIREIKNTQRTQFQWLVGVMVAVGIGLGALYVGIKQVWVAGVQVGQTMQARP